MKTFFLSLYLSTTTLFATIDQTHEIVATINLKSRTIFINQTIEWTNKSNKPATNIYLLLSNFDSEKNSYRSDIINDAKYKKGFFPATHTILSVTTKKKPLEVEFIDSEALLKTQRFSTKQNIAKIILNEPVEKNETITIDVISKKKYPEYYSIKEIQTFQNTTTLRFNWYPIIVNQIFDLRHDIGVNRMLRHNVKKFTLTANEETVIALSASKIKTSSSKNNTKVVANWDYSINNISVTISKKLNQLIKKTKNKTEIKVIYLDQKYKQKAEVILKQAVQAYEYFTEIYGILPYQTIIISNSPIPERFGLASSGYIFLGDSIFRPSNLEKAVLNRIDEFIITHEIAHLWAGFDMDVGSENSVSEGLTQYLTFNFFDDKYGKNKPVVNNNLIFLYKVYFDRNESIESIQNYRLNSQKKYQRLLKNKFDEPIKIALPDSYTNSSYTKDYYKSAIFFSTLETYIGKNNMNQSLKKYFQYTNTNRSFKSLKNNMITSKNMDKFFNKWVIKNENIDFYISNKKSQKVNNKYKSTITINKKGNAPSNCPVRINYQDGSSTNHNLDNTKETNDLIVEHYHPITKITLDPDMKVLETNRYNNHFPRKIQTVGLTDVLFNEIDKYPKLNDLDHYQLYLFTPFIYSLPSKFNSPAQYGIRIKGQQFLDHEWSTGIGLTAIDNYSELSYFAGYNYYFSKSNIFSTLIQYDGKNKINTEIGMVHPIYQKVNDGFYGKNMVNLSTLSYGFSRTTAISSNQAYQSLFISWDYQNQTTKFERLFIRANNAPESIFFPSFSSLISNYFTSFRLAPQLIFIPKLEIGTGKNLITPFNESRIRGISSTSIASEHLLVGSLNLLFPIVRLGQGINLIYGKFTGLNGKLFFENGLFPDHLFDFSSSPFQTIGIELGFGNIIASQPVSFSLGYAQTITSPLQSDNEIYFDIGLELSLFHTAYTF